MAQNSIVQKYTNMTLNRIHGIPSNPNHIIVVVVKSSLLRNLGGLPTATSPQKETSFRSMAWWEKLQEAMVFTLVVTVKYRVFRICLEISPKKPVQWWKSASYCRRWRIK